MIGEKKEKKRIKINKSSYFVYSDPLCLSNCLSVLLSPPELLDQIQHLLSDMLTEVGCVKPNLILALPKWALGAVPKAIEACQSLP